MVKVAIKVAGGIKAANQLTGLDYPIEPNRIAMVLITKQGSRSVSAPVRERFLCEILLALRMEESQLTTKCGCPWKMGKTRKRFSLKLPESTQPCQHLDFS